jgi:hypothetical protein
VRFPRVVDRLHDLVLRDRRYTKLGVGGLARVAFQEVSGRVPTADGIREVIQDFWEYWHEKYDKPTTPHLMWASSGHRVREELSPSQENAIRAWEDSAL